ncbi:FAD-dependent oxidoreductase [Christensenella timonensis]|uniref:FAD-dependent oxidoreductase n=1 Tax=Christensenella timonensis TaxID=1816678 RepID=UPI000B24E19B|nr:FAD-dependent oxidoreductase [Christensenella timonensis]
MKTVTEASREVPVLCEADVVVIGGGAAGIGAALGAGRAGAKTILIERFGCLGGCQTLTFNDSFSFVDDRIQGGLIQEIIDKLHEGGAVYKSSVGSHKAHWSEKEGCFYFDPEYYKFMLENMMKDAGVQLLYHAFAVDGIHEGDELKGVIIESWQGRHAILAKTVIDCTGIADLAWKAGAECTGEEGYKDNKYGPYKGRHMAFGYGYFVRGMDYKRFREFAQANPEEWDDWVKGRKLFTEAKASGKLYSFRNSCIFQEYEDGRVWMLSPGYPIPAGNHPWEAEQISLATVDIRKQAFSILELLKKHVPGFENATIEQTASKLLHRDGHRIVGEYTITEDDMRGGTTFEDAITCCNMPPDPFFPDGGHHFKFDVTPYDIPYRSLVSKDFGNLMAAGGASSMDLITWAALRYCTPSVCTGQAAGTAAAMAAKQGIMPSELNVPELQKELHSQGLVTTNKDLPSSVVEEYARRAEEWGNGFGM